MSFFVQLRNVLGAQPRAKIQRIFGSEAISGRVPIELSPRRPSKFLFRLKPQMCRSNRNLTGIMVNIRNGFGTDPKI
jgi:hypothetical protein